MDYNEPNNILGAQIGNFTRNVTTQRVRYIITEKDTNIICVLLKRIIQIQVVSVNIRLK